MKPLSLNDRHLLKLVRQDANAEGWTKVSSLVWPLVKNLPDELVTTEATETGGRAKLTVAGETVLDWT